MDPSQLSQDEECKHGLYPPTSCSLCNGREQAEAKAAAQITTRITALYPGSCSICHDAIEAGDEIARRADGGWVHDRCGR